MNERVTGTIKTWKPENGYGFAAVNGGRDVFIHIKSLKDKSHSALEVGQEIEFEIAPGKEPGQVQGIDVVLL